MKITQLDYSAIMNANSAQMAAETAAQNNRAIAMTNSINMMNQANFERTKKLQEDALAIQASANKTAAITNIINAGLNVAQAGTGLYQSIKQAKYENDIAAYNLANIQNVADFQTLIATAQNLGEFDESGQFKISDELTAYLDKVVTDIQNSDWTIEVKEQALMQWAEIGASASISIAQEYGTRQRESKATLETLELEEIKKGEVLVESGYDAGYSFIDSLSYDSTTKEAMKLQYRTSVDSGRRTNTALSLLANNGYKASYNYIKGLEGISETERNNLLTTISTQYGNQTTQAGLMAKNLTAELLASGEYTPAQVRELVLQQTGAMNQDADFRKGIRGIIDAEQITWATGQYPDYSRIDYLTPIELDRLYENIKTDDRGVFAGIESTRESMLSTIDEKREVYQTAMDEETAAYVTAQENNYTNYCTTMVNSYVNGSMSAKNAMHSIAEYGDQVLFGYAMQYGMYDEATGSVIFDNEKHGKTYKELELRLAKSESAYFKDLVVKSVPERYQTYVEGSVSTFLENHFDKAYSKLDPENQIEWDKMEARFMDSVLDYVSCTPTDDMSIEKWDIFIKDLGEEFLHESASFYLDIASSKKALVTVDSSNNQDRSNISNAETIAQTEDNAILEMPSGGYAFVNDEVEDTFNIIGQQLATDLVDRNVISEEESQALILSPTTNAEGNLIPMPRITVNGEIFEYKEGLPHMLKDGEWVYIGFPERKPTGTSAPADDGFPTGPAGDMLRADYYNKADYDAGITKAERDEMDRISQENQKSKASSLSRPDKTPK